MSRLLAAYDDYKKKVENLTPYSHIHGWKEIKEFQKSAKIIHRYGKLCSSGRCMGVYLHLDGRVMEYHEGQNGLPQFGAIWNSKQDYDNHREAMPFNIWAWG